MNFLKNTSAYLCGPIESSVNPKRWREEITPKLKKIKINVLNPLVKPGWMPHVDGETQRGMMRDLISRDLDVFDIEIIRKLNHEIRDVCLSLVRNCDFMIAKIIPTEFTVGSWEEIVVAAQCRKPVFFICDNQIPSMWLVDMLDAYETFSETFFKTDNALVSHLININKSGEVVDNIAWIRNKYPPA